MVKIMKFLIVKPSPHPTLVLFGLKYLPQDPVSNTLSLWRLFQYVPSKVYAKYFIILNGVNNKPLSKVTA